MSEPTPEKPQEASGQSFPEASSEFMQGYVFGLTDNMSRPDQYNLHLATIRMVLMHLVADKDRADREIATAAKLFEQMAINECGLWLVLGTTEKGGIPTAIQVNKEKDMDSAKLMMSMTKYWEGIIDDVQNEAGVLILCKAKDGTEDVMPSSKFVSIILTSIAKRLAKDMETV